VSVPLRTLTERASAEITLRHAARLTGSVSCRRHAAKLTELDGLLPADTRRTAAFRDG
jgi:hypothetical protein